MNSLPQIKNILLDRDGTIIYEKYYLHNPEDVEFLPHVISTLKQMTDKQLKLFLITNQSGIGRGYFSLKDYYLVESKIDEFFAKHQIKFQEYLFCPHSPNDNCNCRKPKIGLWKKIKDKYNLDTNKTIMIGDKICDIKFGYNAKLSLNILLLTGHGKKEALRYNLALTSNYILTKFNDKKLIIAKDLYFAWQALLDMKLV